MHAEVSSVYLCVLCGKRNPYNAIPPTGKFDPGSAPPIECSGPVCANIETAG